MFEHLRSWAQFDDPISSDITKDGMLTWYTVAAIADEYFLTRTLPWKGGFVRFAKSAQIVNSATVEMRKATDLSERAEQVSSLAITIQQEFAMSKVPFSAASKLAWFACPKGWTMFDKHVFNALFRRSEGRSKDFPRFYSHLQNNNFDGLCGKVSEVAAKHGVTLVANRVIDKWLMIRGAEEVKRERSFAVNVRKSCEDFQLSCSPQQREAAKAIGKMLEGQMPRESKLSRKGVGTKRSTSCKKIKDAA